MNCISNFTNECGIYFEHSVEYKGKPYLVIYGYHEDGNFVFLPRQLRGCTIENDFQPISKRIIETGIKAEFAALVEQYIEKWKKDHPEEIEKVISKKLEILYEKNKKTTL